MVFIVKQSKNLDYQSNEEYLLTHYISCQDFRLRSLKVIIIPDKELSHDIRKKTVAEVL